MPTWRESRIEHIDIDTNVHHGLAHAVFDLAYDARGAVEIKITRGDDSEAAPNVVPGVALASDQGGADACVY